MEPDSDPVLDAVDGMCGIARNVGGQGQNRTADTVIFSHVLYQLSYLAAGKMKRRV